MRTLPRQDRRARTGSTLRGSPIGTHRKRLQQKADRRLSRLTREYHRAGRRLFSARDLGRVRAIEEQVKLEWRQASLKAKGSATRLEKLKDAARRKFHRMARRAVPRYARWQKLSRSYRQQYRKVAGALAMNLTGSSLSVAWGNLLLDPPPGAVEFSPPFATYDVQLLDPNHRVTSDNSFVQPGSGLLINNVVFNRDESTPTIIGLFGLTTRPDTATSLVCCGRNYLLPAPDGSRSTPTSGTTTTRRYSPCGTDSGSPMRISPCRSGSSWTSSGATR